MQQLQFCSSQFYQLAAIRTDDVIWGKERRIVDTNDGGGQCSGRDARIERERNWEDVSQSDAVQEMKCNQPTNWNFRACGSSNSRPGGERKKTGYGNNTTDADLGNLGRLRIFFRPQPPKDNGACETTYGQD